MNSYLFKKVGDKFISIDALSDIYSDSNSDLEKVRSTDQTFSRSECLQLKDDDQIIVVQRTQDIIDGYNFPISKQQKIQALTNDFNSSKKITIQNGDKTLNIKHDTPERKYFLKLIEQVSNLSKLKKKKKGVFIYKQSTDAGSLAFRILPEIAAYIFEDLFVATLNNPQQTEVNAREHNQTTVYELALESINKAKTQAELDEIAWNFLNPTGIVIDVNAKAKQILDDATVSEFAKNAINAIKDPITNEIYLIKTLPELSAES